MDKAIKAIREALLDLLTQRQTLDKKVSALQETLALLTGRPSSAPSISSEPGASVRDRMIEILNLLQESGEMERRQIGQQLGYEGGTLGWPLQRLVLEGKVQQTNAPSKRHQRYAATGVEAAPSAPAEATPGPERKKPDMRPRTERILEAMRGLPPGSPRAEIVKVARLTDGSPVKAAFGELLRGKQIVQTNPGRRRGARFSLTGAGQQTQAPAVQAKATPKRRRATSPHDWKARGPAITKEQVRDFIISVKQFTLRDIATNFDRHVSWAHHTMKPYVEKGMVASEPVPGGGRELLYRYVPPTQPSQYRPRMGLSGSAGARPVPRTQELANPGQRAPVPGTGKQRMGTKDMRPMLVAARNQGFRTQQDGGHIIVSNPRTGKSKSISASPSDRNAHRRAREDLIELGVRDI